MRTERQDLNLFRVFGAVFTHRNLVAAGRDLGISASAVSHALTRLRALLGDDLFVAGVRGMSPTARAVELAPSIAGALAALNEVMASKTFDQATTDRVFRIGASDYTSAILMPPLVSQVLQGAPKARLRIRPFGRVDLIEHLDEGRLDLIVGWFGETPARIRRRALFEDKEALVVRCDHPLAGTEPSKAALLSFPHLVVDLTGSDELQLDGFERERGLHRRVWVERLLLENAARDKADRLASVTIPSYGLVGSLVRSTDMIATLPLRLARLSARQDGLVLLDPPYEPLNVTVEVAWHERADADPALQWLVEQAVLACATLEALATASSDSAPD